LSYHPLGPGAEQLIITEISFEVAFALPEPDPQAPLEGAIPSAAPLGVDEGVLQPKSV
jgi:hypothetical protein